MLNTRRWFLKKGITATGGLVAFACLPHNSYAGGCKSDTQYFNIDQQGVINIFNWKLGDCELRPDRALTTGSYFSAGNTPYKIGDTEMQAPIME